MIPHNQENGSGKPLADAAGPKFPGYRPMVLGEVISDGDCVLPKGSEKLKETIAQGAEIEAGDIGFYFRPEAKPAEAPEAEPSSSIDLERIASDLDYVRRKWSEEDPKNLRGMLMDCAKKLRTLTLPSPVEDGKRGTHTPIGAGWRALDPRKTGNKKWIIVGDSFHNGKIAQVEELGVWGRGEANAKLIVQAVNSLESMRKALGEAERGLFFACNFLGAVIGEDMDKDRAAAIRKIYDAGFAARAALAEAGGA